jgi:hypothetical protein
MKPKKPMNTKTVRKIADQEVYKHEKNMHGAKKMKQGGPTGMDMRKMGRNMARAMNQRGG